MSQISDLPNDVNALKAMVLGQRTTISTLETANTTLEAANTTLEAANTTLESLIIQYRRALFGKRSEKVDPDTRQLSFEDFETGIETQQAIADEALNTAKAQTNKPAVKRKVNRGNLPEDLPRIERVIEPETTICECGCQRHIIGEDTSERLHIVPAQFSVIVTRRPKYACRACEDKVWQAPAPASLIPGGLPTEATVAHVLVSKYADHLPLYRQAQIYSRQGLDLDRSTLAKWVGRAAHALTPVYEALKADLKTSTKLFMDETVAPVQDPGTGKTKRGYFWALARDDRPFTPPDTKGDPPNAPPGVVFTYAPSRSGNVAAEILADFNGVLQVDGYAGYNKVLYRREAGVTLVYCWAHARRKLFEISQSDTPTPIADSGIEFIAKLYALEVDIRGQSAEQRLAARQELAKPIIADIKQWLDTHRAQVSPKAPTGKALAYIHKHWDGLCLFLTDGRIELDNNTVERTIRPIALNRKNALFAGHDTGAQAWAMIASLIETCKLNDVNPHSYLAHVLETLVEKGENVDHNSLMPWHFS